MHEQQMLRSAVWIKSWIPRRGRGTRPETKVVLGAASHSVQIDTELLDLLDGEKNSFCDDASCF